MMRNSWLLLFFLLATIRASAAGTAHEPMGWVRYNNKLSFGHSWYVLSEWEMRLHADPIRANQVLLPRISVGRSWNQYWTGAAGLSLFLTYLPADAREPIAITQPEYRGHQDLLWKRSRSGWTLEQRWRLEQRLIRPVASNLLLDDLQFRWRFRWMVQANRQVWTKGNRALKVFVFQETLAQAGKSVRDQFIDQLRFGAGGHLTLSPTLEMDLHYFYWHQYTALPDVLIQRDILRFTVYHHLNF